MFASVVLGLVFSALRHEIGWEELTYFMLSGT